jgi:hypothetical protein
MIRYCPQCGRSIPQDATNCPYCGKMLAMSEGIMAPHQQPTKDDSGKKLVLIIAIILVVIILGTIIIAAMVYIYVSGMVGPSTRTFTPTCSLTADPTGTSCVITIATISESGIDWSSDVEIYLTDITSPGIMPSPTSPTGYVSGGDQILIYDLVDNYEYRFTLVYTPTGGTMGSVSWTQ